MKLKHKLFLTDNYFDFRDAVKSRETAIVTTDDINAYKPYNKNIYNAAILVPPTRMLEDHLNGIYDMSEMYPIYLSEPDVEEFIIAILASTFKRDTMLYIPPDEYDMFGWIIMKHIADTYDVYFDPVSMGRGHETLMTENISCNGFVRLIDKMYEMKLISRETYQSFVDSISQQLNNDSISYYQEVNDKYLMALINTKYAPKTIMAKKIKRNMVKIVEK